MRANKELNTTEKILRKTTLLSWIEKIHEEINNLECDDKQIKHILVESHWSIVRRFQEMVKDIDLELERIRIDEYEKSRVEGRE